MRVGEMKELRWSHVHGSQLVVPPEFCKARKPHVIAIAGDLLPIIERRKAARIVKNEQVCAL